MGRLRDDAVDEVVHDPERRPGGAEGAAPGARRPRWRAWVALLLAVLLPPLIVRGCVLDVYEIESSSMEPAFHGGPGIPGAPAAAGEPDSGDHLLVLRRGCDRRPVQRWDVVVVDGSVDPERPEGVGAMLKRVVGLSGESLYIAHGDIYVSGGDAQDGEAAAPAGPQLVRKPDELIAALLVPMHTGAGLQPPWTWVGPGTSEELPGGGTRLACSAPSGGTAVYQSFVDDGLPGQPGEVPVADTALEVEVGACDGILGLQLREGADVFSARLAPAAKGGASLHHNLGASVVASAPDFPGLQPGQKVLMWNVDNGVRVRIDGRTLLAWNYPANGPQVGGSPERNDPWITVEDGAIELRHVTVLRDVDYLAQGVYGADSQAPFHVPGGDLFLLGDNSTHSRDSRFFGPVPTGLVRGRPLAIYSPWRRARWLGPGGVPW